MPFSFGSQGHEAFCSSTFTSLKKFLVLVITRIVEELKRRKRCSGAAEAANIERPTSNIERRPIPGKSHQTSNLIHHISRTRQEGLEPPTDGFGDRYSTN